MIPDPFTPLSFRISRAARWSLILFLSLSGTPHLHDPEAYSTRRPVYTGKGAVTSSLT